MSEKMDKKALKKKIFPVFSIAVKENWRYTGEKKTTGRKTSWNFLIS